MNFALLESAGGQTLSRLLLIALIVGLLTPLASAEEFCALTADLQYQDGRPARLTPVRLTDPAGKVVFDGPAVDSQVRICDFGFGPHKLEVGYTFCYPVAISGLRLRLGRPIRLTIRLNDCPPDEWRGSCRAYLRVRNSSESPIEGVAISWGTGQDPVTTDRFGRAEISILPDTSTAAVLAKPGYATEKVILRCETSEDIERTISLRALQ